MAIVVWFSPIGEALQIIQLHQSLKTRKGLSEIADAMVGLMKDGETTVIRKDHPEFPGMLKRMGGKRILCGAERVSVEFGGGFYHCGYHLQEGAGGSLKLICYGENPEDDIVLLTMPDPEI